MSEAVSEIRCSRGNPDRQISPQYLSYSATEEVWVRPVSLVCFFLKKTLSGHSQAVCSWRLWPLGGRRDQLVPASLEEVSGAEERRSLSPRVIWSFTLALLPWALAPPLPSRNMLPTHPALGCQWRRSPSFAFREG